MVHLVEPLFARYPFIKLDGVTTNWYPIRSTMGVHALVLFRSSVNPVSVPDHLIKGIKIVQEQNFTDESQLSVYVKSIKLWLFAVDFLWGFRDFFRSYR